MDKIAKKLDELENLYAPMKQFYNFFEGYNNENEALKFFPSLVKVARFAKHLDDNLEIWYVTNDIEALKDARNCISEALRELGDL